LLSGLFLDTLLQPAAKQKPMKKLSLWIALGYLGLTLMSAIWLGLAWMILHDGGFTKSYRLTKETTYVDGPAAVVMALIFIALAVIALAVVYQGLRKPKT
jgi:hypothetical protein